MRLTLAAGLLAGGASLAEALDLPVKNINGRECFYYTVGQGETLYAISQKLGIGRSEIVKYNPSSEDGVHAGEQLFFPVDEYGSKYGVSTSTVYHEVKKGETLYGLAHKYNVSSESIAALNPEVVDGLKAGQVVKIPIQGASKPAEECDDSWRASNRAAAKEETYITPPEGRDPEQRELTPVNPAIGVIVDDAEEEDVTKADDPRSNWGTPVDVSERGDSATIAIIMPFMLDESKMSRASALTTDFYRGFLIAADTMSATMPQHVTMLVYDTRNSTDRLRNYLSLEKRLPKADVIIAPDNAEHLGIIAEYAEKYNVPVLNNFVVKDTAYYSNPNILQANIESRELTDRAIKEYVDICVRDGFTPIILSAPDGRNDKQSFVDEFIVALTAEGILPRTFEYGTAPTVDALVEALGEPTAESRFLFIPNGASLNEFNKLSPALERFNDRVLGVGARMRLVGYPEWTTFRAEAADAMHNLDTTIYSRFFGDAGSYESAGVTDAFRHWYGAAPLEGVPSQALMGFDTGCFVFDNIARGNRLGENPSSWRGVQTTYTFGRSEGHAGLMNTAVYIVRFLPGGVYDVAVL